MSTDGLYAGAPGRRAPVCVVRRLFRTTTKTPGAFLSVSPNGVRYMDVSQKKALLVP